MSPAFDGNRFDRRSFLKIGGLAAAAIASPTLLDACSSSKKSGAAASTSAASSTSGASSAATSSAASGASSAASSQPAAVATKMLKVGYVSPQTGSLAPFGEADSFVVTALTNYFKANPFAVGSDHYGVQVSVKDSQSDSKRCGEVANDLILQEGIDLMLVASTPDTVNPVADACEANGVPCISTVAPWQPYFIGRGGKPGSTSFKWTYHFFWGLEDVEAVYLDMWDAVPTNKKTGAIWPNDPDGNAWGDAVNGFGPVVAKRGYSIIDPGHYPDGTQDFSAQIAKFKSGDAEVLLGVPIPPDFTTFWKQAVQQGFKPKIATIGKALLFPSSIEALGDTGQNLGSEVWWSPSHPFTSSLTKQSAKDLAADYTSTTGKQWTQPIGFVHAMFEVASAAVSKAGSTDKAAVAAALSTLKLSTVVGPLDWTSGPVPNVTKTPLVGGQWRKSGTGYDLIIVTNKQHPEIPAGGTVEALA
jgi:branched-chain amino acid transport system substrate-binding protein